MKSSEPLALIFQKKRIYFFGHPKIEYRKVKPRHVSIPVSLETSV